MTTLSKSIVHLIKRNRLIRQKFEEFRDPDIALCKINRTMGQFIDGAGHNLSLIAGLRDAIKPGWQTMLAKDPGYSLPNKMEVETRRSHAQRAINNLTEALGKFGLSIQNKKILEIGCYDGSTTYGLASSGVGEVVGSDISRYYISQSVECVNSVDMNNKVNAHLDSLRQIYADAYGYSATQWSTKGPKVSFVEDNIVSSELSSNSFDVVCSWESLEHITDIKGAFNQINRLLKPGGLAFHEYNPFFSLNGGHSLCTLDFLWGHARLAEKDFVRYLDENRPYEKEQALRFYRENLNRMTLSDLSSCAVDAGLETLALFPLAKKSHWQLLTKECIEQAYSIYSTLTPMDFVSPTVWVVHRKKW